MMQVMRAFHRDHQALRRLFDLGLMQRNPLLVLLVVRLDKEKHRQFIRISELFSILKIGAEMLKLVHQCCITPDLICNETHLLFSMLIVVK
ncbi:hypothetical protein D3C76_1760260 [compost metagenome]